MDVLLSVSQLDVSVMEFCERSKTRVLFKASSLADDVADDSLSISKISFGTFNSVDFLEISFGVNTEEHFYI